MDPNLHNFLLSYIYNLNKDKLDELVANNTATKKRLNSGVAASSNNNSTHYLANFYKYLDVMCDIYDIKIKPEERSLENKYIRLFKKLGEIIDAYNITLKNELSKPIDIFYFNIHGKYCIRKLSNAIPIIHTVPKNFVVIFTTPLNYYAGVNTNPDDIMKHLKALKNSLLDKPENIACLMKNKELHYFEILLPNQKYFDLELSFDKSANTNSTMNLYCLRKEGDIHECMSDEMYSDSLSQILDTQEKKQNTHLTYLFINSCRSLNISHTLANNGNTKSRVLNTSNNMYIYYNFMYYYNFYMLKCETLKRIGFFTYKYDYFKDLTLKQLNMLDKTLATKLIKKNIIGEYNKHKTPDLPNLEDSDLIIKIDSPQNITIQHSILVDKQIDKILFNSIITNVIDNFEKFIRKEQSFRNTGNKRLGIRGKNAINQATKFSKLNNSSNTPLYAKLRRIIKATPLYKALGIPNVESGVSLVV